MSSKKLAEELILKWGSCLQSRKWLKIYPSDLPVSSFHSLKYQRIKWNCESWSTKQVLRVFSVGNLLESSSQRSWSLQNNTWINQVHVVHREHSYWDSDENTLLHILASPKNVWPLPWHIKAEVSHSISMVNGCSISLSLEVCSFGMILDSTFSLSHIILIYKSDFYHLQP